MIRNFILRMPQWLEMVVVVALCFGLSIGTSILSLVSGKAFTRVEFTDQRAITTLLLELALTVSCLAFLRLRNYNIRARLKLKPTTKATFSALGLFALTYLVYALLFGALTYWVGQENLPVAKYTISVKWPLILAVSLVNPLFEETFVLGYLFDKLAAKGVWFTLMVSTVVRMSYHGYQGWVGLVSMFSMGVIFVAFYARSRNLWAFYLAHALMDFTGLMAN